MRYLFILLFLLILPLNATAEETTQPPSLEEIPEVLRAGLITIGGGEENDYKWPTTLEQYQAVQLDFFKYNAAHYESLKYSDLEHEINKILQKEIDRKEKSFAGYDLNKDDKISQEEGNVDIHMMECTGAQCEDVKVKARDRIRGNFNLDLDHIEFITKEKFIEIPPDRQKNLLNRDKIEWIQGYLEIDPNHDNQLTASELKKLTADIFKKYDLDQDNILKPSDLIPFLGTVRQSDLYSRFYCGFPEPNPCRFEGRIYEETRKRPDNR